MFSAGIRKGRESEADIYFLQQHYRIPTRLLDWTTNALAALYFVCAEHDGEDGELFLMDAYELGKKITKGIATSRHPVFRDVVKTFVDWSSPDNLPDSIFPVRPDHFDRRMSLQRSCFTFHVPKEKILTPITVVTLKVSGTKKRKIVRQLSLLGIDHFSVYGDLEHLAKTLTEAYTTQK